MKRLLIAAPALVLLCACGSKSEGRSGSGSVSLTNASSEEVAKAAADAGAGTASFNPGKWETRYEVVSLEMPGISGAMKDQMNKMMAGKVTTDQSCMTPEEAKNPRARMFSGKDKSNCTFRKFNMGGGKIDAEMACPGEAGGGEMVMTMAGDFAPDSYTMNAAADMKGGSAPMAMKIKLSGKRIGECSAS